VFQTEGFHHVTVVSRDAGVTLRFCRDVLGLRLVKQTVNFDRPTTYHLYFADRTGSPGTILTFFEWPDAAPGNYGLGGIHHIALSVPDEAAQLKWKRRLADAGVPVSGPYNRGYFTSIYFRDPDGLVLEIATAGPGYATDEPADALGQSVKPPPPAQLPGYRDEAEIAALTHPEPVETITPDMAITAIHHVTGFTDDAVAAGEFYERTLGLKLIKRSVNQDDPTTPHLFWASYDGQTVKSGSSLTMFEWPSRARRAREGVGQTHHIAYRAKDEEQLGAWREYLLSIGIGVSEIRDRSYFKSIYFNAPDGLLFEIATDPPGFALDEEVEALGSELRLPSWLSDQRDSIAAGLKPLETTAAR